MGLVRSYDLWIDSARTFWRHLDCSLERHGTRSLVTVGRGHVTCGTQSIAVRYSEMGLVRITSWYPNFNGSQFGLPPSKIHRMTGLRP